MFYFKCTRCTKMRPFPDLPERRVWCKCGAEMECQWVERDALMERLQTSD